MFDPGETICHRSAIAISSISISQDTGRHRNSTLSGERVMSLLDDVLEAAGGVDRWRGLKQFTAHLSIDGELLRNKGKAGLVREVVVEGSTPEQTLQITGFTAPDRRALLHSDRVAIERADGVLLEEQLDPRSAFAGHNDTSPWSDWHLAYYCGCLIWPCLFLYCELAAPDAVVVELSSTRERHGGWRRLKITLPERFATFASEQIVHFDSSAMPRCVEYSPTLALGKRLVEELSAHQRFSDVIIPTLRQGWFLDHSGARRRRADLEVEIFDAAFA
jgi:hypothetical protein